ncbi:MAG: hypothetical protein V7K64_28390 [Nostoc sp.]|uniref:hypothetical protein n=1 Tax=unclassified Nostoc TaxID=2593658 RepID=UPI001DE51DAF|nr:hypothetical protein [Nostoc sp. JL34]MBN3882542.1 hypothetical protein [Nostoc sp. JL34]
MSKISLVSLKSQANQLLTGVSGVTSIGAYWDNPDQPVLRIDVDPGTRREVIEKHLKNINPPNTVVKIDCVRTYARAD